MAASAKKLLQPSDFDECPVWSYDEDGDNYYPVRVEGDLPEQSRDLRILAEFVTPSGRKLRGYVGGVERVFAIGLFGEGRIFHVNKNLREPSKDQVQEFLAETGLASILAFESMFPMRFETQWENDTFANFSGVFDM